jgi:hypothetical protein
MNTSDVIKFVKDSLTGDNQVDLETQDTSITRFVENAVERVKPWYHEKRIYETIFLNDSGGGSSQNGNSKWFLKSALSKKMDDIHMVYNTQQESAGASDIDSNLYGLQSRMIYTADIGHAAAYQGFQSQLSTFVGNKIRWIVFEDRVMLSGYFSENRATICYYPLVEKVEDVTNGKVMLWIKDWVLAKTMEAAARIRGKFRGGDINMETDSDEMIGTVQTMLSDLDDRLTNMQFTETM